MTSRNARIATFAVVVLAILGLGYALGDRLADDDRPQAETTRHAKNAVAGKDASTLSASAPRPHAALPTPAPQQPIDALMANAMAGDAGAIREVFWRYDECFYYNAPRNVSHKNLDALARARPEFRRQAEWIKRYRRSRCFEVEGGRPYDTAAVHQWLQALRELGDPVGELGVGAIAEGKTDPETLRKLQAIVERQAIDKDPEVAYLLGTVGRAQTAALPENLLTFFQGDLSAYAWQIAACRAGYDSGCGWGSRVMNQQCEFFSQCQYVSYEQMVLMRHVPPAQRAEFFDAVRRIQTRFL
jgi:hypothetical protein